MTDGQLILAAGALLSGGLMAALLAGRMGVPSLVLFLGVGMLVGSDGLDGSRSATSGSSGPSASSRWD